MSDSDVTLDAESIVLTAIADHIKETFGYTDDKCGVQLDGVPPSMGEFYVAVSTGTWGGDVFDTSLVDIISFNVYVYVRAMVLPRDRRHKLQVENLGNLNSRVEAVRNAIGTRSAAILTRFNDLATGSGLQFNSAPVWLPPIGSVETVSAELFASTGQPDAGIRRRISFGGVEWYRTFAEL